MHICKDDSFTIFFCHALSSQGLVQTQNSVLKGSLCRSSTYMTPPGTFCFTKVVLNQTVYCCHIFVETAQSYLSRPDTVQNRLRAVSDEFFTQLHPLPTNETLQGCRYFISISIENVQTIYNP